MENSTTVNVNSREYINATYPELNATIFFDGLPLPTTKGGSYNSKGGVILTAHIEGIGTIIWRSCDAHGKKGFNFQSAEYTHSSMISGRCDDLMTAELRSRLSYKY